MKKFFTFVMALVAAVSLNAATQVVFDFSDATAYGYANPEAGKYTQVENGAVLSKDGVTITIAFESGNGFRFFANTKTGVINLRGYVGASFTIAAPEGKKLAAIAADGQNLTTQYLADGMTSKNWTSDEGVASLTTNVIKSTVQFNSLTITIIDEGEEPPTQETVKVDVAGAIAAGQALADGKTSEEVYEVTGFVVNAQPYNPTYKNQIWWMSDDAENTGAQEFEAYACTVSENSTIMQVLNGDKVTLTGNITKYNDTKNNKIIIEIKNGTAVFVSKAEGDHSIGGDTPPATDLDTITVAKALEIGGALPSGGKTDVQYVIEGYVSDIVAAYTTAADFETFWMVDEKGSRAKTNADGAFEVYKGNPVQKMTAGLDGHVYVTSKIQNYQGKVIETSGTAVVNIVEQGTVEEIEAITVAKAMEIGGALADQAVSDKTYEITGYVSNVYNFLNPDYGSETLYISDDPESTSTENAFQIYRGKPSTKTATGLHAKVKVVTKIKNYKGTIETDGSTIPFEVLEASTFVPDTVNIDEVVNLTEPLAENAKTPVYYVVKGFIQEPGTFDSKNSNATFKLSQFPNEAEGLVTAYRATVLKDDAEKVATKNSYVNVTGYLMKKGGAQIAQGAITAFVEAPQTDTIHVNVAEAVAEGLKLPMGGKSDRIYAVTGFVNLVSEEFAEGVESFFLADDATSEAYNFFAADASIDKAVEVGQQVEIVGRLQNADDEIVTIDHGQARYIPGEGIENIVLTEKVQKVVVDGAIYIVRDGKMFNLQGAQVR